MQGMIRTHDLRRLVRNAKVYSTKSSATKGATAWIAGVGVLRVVSKDDFIAVQESCGAGINVTGTTFLTHSDLISLSKTLEGYTDEGFDLSGLPGETGGVPTNAQDDLLGIDWAIGDLENWDEPVFASFALDPGRLSKLNRLEGREDYPLDITSFSDSGVGPVVAFKVGPDIQGVISPLDRQVLRELYAEEPGALW